MSCSKCVTINRINLPKFSSGYKSRPVVENETSPGSDCDKVEISINFDRFNRAKNQSNFDLQFSISCFFLYLVDCNEVNINVVASKELKANKSNDRKQH